MQNTLKLMCQEANVLADLTVEQITHEISDGPITDAEEFNLMMMAIRNVIKAQQKTIRALQREAGLTP